MTFSLVHPPLPSPSIFSLSPHSTALSLRQIAFYRSRLTTVNATDMTDSPETAQHFIFMYDPTTSTVTESSSNYTLYLKQHPACFCRCVLPSPELCIDISSLFQPFVRHIYPCLAGAYGQVQTPLSAGTGSRVSTASGVTYGKLHGLQLRSLICFAGARTFLRLSCICADTPQLVFSYWVLAVGCFLLYCFVNDHSLELCLKIYKVGVRCYPRRGHFRYLASRRYPSHSLCGTS